MMGERKREYVYDERETERLQSSDITFGYLMCSFDITFGSIHQCPSSTPTSPPLNLPPFLLPLLLSSPISTTRKEKFSLIWTSVRLFVCRSAGWSVCQKKGREVTLPFPLIKITIVGNKPFFEIAENWWNNVFKKRKLSRKFPSQDMLCGWKKNDPLLTHIQYLLSI